MLLSNGALLILIILGIVAWKITTRSKSTASAPFPPGPPADPIIGHIRIAPRPPARAEVVYQKWAEEYQSDVLYLNMMGQPVIVLNSAQSAIDLMDKHSSIYSDRPNFHLYEESGWSLSLPFLGTGPNFRKHRKMLQNAFSAVNIVQYRDKQEALSRVLVSQIARKPDRWRELIMTFSSSIILDIAYGIKVTDENDPFITLTDKMAWFFNNAGLPGSTLIDMMPIIRHLPSWIKVFPSLNFARNSYPIVREFYEAPFAEVKKSMASREPKVSFVRSILEQNESLEPADEAAKITEDDIKGAAATLFNAGALTTYTTLTIFVLMMVLHPEIQEKARQEIDQVIGRDRLPSLSDRGKLPHIDRLWYETVRWHVTVPLGVPHKSTKDHVYKGLFIPKKSLVMANSHAILHDPSIYANPEEFNPDRYISASEGGAGEPLPVGHFGFGRRICPGQYLATASVWIAIATMLATSKISKALDDSGKEIAPAPRTVSGITSEVEEFPCVIKLRDEQAVRLIEKAT